MGRRLLCNLSFESDTSHTGSNCHRCSQKVIIVLHKLGLWGALFQSEKTILKYKTKTNAGSVDDGSVFSKLGIVRYPFLKLCHPWNLAGKCVQSPSSNSRSAKSWPIWENGSVWNHDSNIPLPVTLIFLQGWGVQSVASNFDPSPL